MQSSPASHQFLHLRSKYSPQHLVLRYLQSVLLSSFILRQKKKKSKIMLLYVLIFKVLDRRRKDKRFCT
jgi:hypothetical protein